MIGFGGGWSGIIGAVGGLLACIGSSILMCCAPKSPSEGGGKFFGAGVLLLIAGVIQLIMAIVTVILMAMLLTAVNEIDACSGYKDCPSSMECTGSTICYQEPADSVVVSNDNSCWTAEDGECADGAIGSTNTWCSCGTDLTDCGTRTTGECAAIMTCSSEASKKFCEDLHGGATDVVSALVVRRRGLQTAAQWPCWQCGPHPSVEAPLASPGPEASGTQKRPRCDDRCFYDRESSWALRSPSSSSPGCAFESAPRLPMARLARMRRHASLSRII